LPYQPQFKLQTLEYVFLTLEVLEVSSEGFVILKINVFMWFAIILVVI